MPLPWETDWSMEGRKESPPDKQPKQQKPWEVDWSTASPKAPRTAQKQPTIDSNAQGNANTLESVFKKLLVAESGSKHRDEAGNLITSKVGAQGISQLMPSTAKKPGYGITPVKDDSEEEYLRVGREYLSAMYNKYQDWEKALAAYNAGTGNVDKAIGKAERYEGDWKEFLPKPKETLPYIEKILGKPKERISALNIPPEKIQKGQSAGQMVENVKQTAYDIASIAPVTGEAIAAKDFYSALKEGDMSGMALAGIGMIPGVGMIGKASKMGRGADVLKKADQLEKSGVNPDKIFQELGVYKGPVDGEWRAVISDKEAKLNLSSFKRNSLNKEILSIDGVRQLQNVLDHPELFKAFPELKTVKVKTGFGQYDGAVYDETTNTIWLGANTNELNLTSTILHEAQHAVQSSHKLTRGGSVAGFVAKPELYEAAKKQILQDYRSSASKVADKFAQFNQFSPEDKLSKDILNSQEYKRFKAFKELKEKADTLDKENFERYMRIGGEAEARATEAMFKNEGNKGIQGPSAQYGYQSGYIKPTKDSSFPLDFYDRKVEQLTASPLDNRLQESVSLEKLAKENPERFLSTLRPVQQYVGEVEDAQIHTLMHGSKSEEKFTHVSAKTSKDGALGPGFYLTGDEDAAKGYGKNVRPVMIGYKKPLEITYTGKDDVVEQIASNEDFWKTNFLTKGQARKWARQQKEDFAGIGDEDFLEMLKDAGFDGVIMRDESGKIVEATAVNRNQFRFIDVED